MGESGQLTTDPGIQPLLLARSIGRLALPADQQIAWLQGVGDEELPVDELALSMQDQVPLVDEMVARAWLSAQDQELVLEISDLLGDMSGLDRAELWTHDALLHSEQWAAVRTRAQAFFTSGG